MLMAVNIDYSGTLARNRIVGTVSAHGRNGNFVAEQR